MRHVVDSREVAHLWFHQSQGDARNPGNTMYFIGDTIYSYGSHFPIARIVTRKREKVVLFTTRGYSSTTNRHKSDTWRAIPSGTRVFRVDRPDREPAQCVDYFAGKIEGIAENVTKPRIRATTRVSNFDHLLSAVDEANEFCKFFGIRRKFKAPESIDAVKDAVESARKQAEAAERKRQRDYEKRQAEKKAEAEKLAEAWVNGGEWSHGLYSARTRLRIEGDEVATSMGVRFPLSHAALAIPLVQRLRSRPELLPWPEKTLADSGYSITVPTVRLGHYRIDRIDAKGIKAGCHFIDWQEFDRVSPLILAALPRVPESPTTEGELVNA
jgi:hypothetical protein